jgi:hypothetical protein
MMPRKYRASLRPPRRKVPPKHVIVVSDSSDTDVIELDEPGPTAPVPWDPSSDTTAQISGISSRITSPRGSRRSSRESTAQASSKSSRESSPPPGLHTQSRIQWYCEHPLPNDVNLRYEVSGNLIDREPDADPRAIEYFVHHMEISEASYAEDPYFRQPPDPRILWEEAKEDARLRRLVEDWHRLP